ncbi:ABC transporter substrate-binding protein [Burkholderia cepacia]|uniref:ABC transporter substrate-binding protein n=1 Tax=Burkholderia cepacia TaxID=292 RepID=UPI000759E1AC|nr:ABC transporter substrate-binding protein [Burkholderia cepacia]KVQ18857.1 ABC transporter substrate-binding protein [Burkholderia cepacia]KVZ97244.1 ABC transporter substrate-binding protein [Burkholderia cepacia]KWH32260.1 ABC transporter substrate-binding protein [Burkholderia cepacia]
MRTPFITAVKSLICAIGFAVAAAPAAADDVQLMKGVVPRQDDNSLTRPDQFKKKGPWKIGMSHFGLSNTWSIQMARDAEAEAGRHAGIAQFLLRNANLSASKQVSDIEDLIAQGVDALIVTPLTPTSAEAGIKEAVAKGIPVIVHTGLVKTDDYTVDIQAGGVYFGRVMGDFLVKQLGGKGNIWVLRGVPGHPEDISRYQGLLNALKGTQIRIVAEGYGNWEYDGGKKLCEAYYLSKPDVQGIWSSGADLSRACVDVLKQYGAAIPPITGEGNNGFFKMWRNDRLTSIAPEYGPEQGAAGVRAAVALLEGKQLHKYYIYNPPPITVAERGKYLRDDLSDAYWFPTSLSEQQKQKFYGIKH